METEKNVPSIMEKAGVVEIDLAALESKMKTMDCQIDIAVNHIFSAGVYIRQIDIPAGTIIMGHRHRDETCNMLIKGKLAVYVDENSKPEIIEGPYIFTSPPFAKKLALCLEDAVFANLIPTTLKDVDEIEKQKIIPENEYLALKGGSQCLSLP